MGKILPFTCLLGRDAVRWSAFVWLRYNPGANLGTCSQMPTMSDEEAKGDDVAAAAAAAAEEDISFLALQQHADRVDADLVAAVARFVDAPTHKDWRVMARRVLFLDDDVEDADIAGWRGADLDSWSPEAARGWVSKWHRGILVRVLKNRRHLLHCQSVSRVVEQLRRCNMWTASACGRTSLALGAALVDARVTPLVMLLRGMGDVLLHDVGMPSSVRALWVTDVDLLTDASLALQATLLQRPNTKVEAESLRTAFCSTTYVRHPLASPQSTSALFAREAACKQLQDVTRKIVVAKADPQQRLRRHAFPVLCAAGAPGIGKSHFLDSMGTVLAEAEETEGHEVVHVNLSFKHSTGWVAQEEDMLFDSILAARLAYAFVAVEGTHGTYDAFLQATPWVQHASAAAVLHVAAAAHLDHSNLASDTPVLFAIGIDEVQALLARHTGTEDEAEGPRRLSRLFAAVGHMMQACRYPVVVVAAGVRRAAMEDAIRSSAYVCEHLALPWFDRAQRLAWFDALGASSLSSLSSLSCVGVGVGGDDDAVQAAKATIAREHRDMAWLQRLLDDTSGLPRLVVLVAQEVVHAVVRKGGVMSEVNGMGVRGRVAARFRTWRTSFATGVALSVPNLVEILAYVLGRIPIRREEPLLHVVTREDASSEVTRTPRSAAWLETEGVVTCVDEVEHVGDGGEDDDGGEDGSGGHGASSSGGCCARVVVLQMPWLVVQAWVDVAWTEFQSKKPSSEVARVLAGPLGDAYRTFLWCCRRWRKHEEARSPSFVVWDAMRASACLVVRHGGARGVAWGEEEEEEEDKNKKSCSFQPHDLVRHDSS